MHFPKFLPIHRIQYELCIDLLYVQCMYVLTFILLLCVVVQVKPQSIDTLMIMAEKLGLNFISTQVSSISYL